MKIYKELSFKCGLEIHQQLETHNLFCNCPSIVRDPNKPDLNFNRKLRASAGETGSVDLAAAFEMKKGKKMFYDAVSTSTCLVEMDEEPPHELNDDALDTALIVAMLLNAKPIDQVHIMRKVVVDGSNTTGFQRTMLIAEGGFIETSKGKVTIESICLEEESAQKIKASDNSINYRLDRLGIPLIEVATGPDIKDPEHAKEVASILGMILRSTNRVKRGIGTIRQDVNVSIKGHPRVEVKGFQELKYMPKVIEGEISRQQKEKKGQPHVRKANPDGTTTYLRPMPGSSRMYPETDTQPFNITTNRLKLVKIPELITEKAIKLEKKYKLSTKLAKEVLNNEQFEILSNKYLIEPSFIAQVLVELPKELESRLKINSSKLTDKHFEYVIENIAKEKVPKSAALDILSKLAQGKNVNLDDYKAVSSSNLEKEIKDIIAKNKGASFNAIMGEVMKKFRGKVDGKQAMDIIKKLI